MNTEGNNGRSLAAIIAERKAELKEFLQTRVDLFKSEVQEKTENSEGRGSPRGAWPFAAQHSLPVVHHGSRRFGRRFL